MAYKISCEEDIKKIMKNEDDSIFFKVIETGEEITLSDLLYLYDGQQITIER